MIICAAIKIKYVERIQDEEEKELIVCGHRHGNCFDTMELLDLNICSYVEGFINHNGKFLNRKEALAHAYDCGQIPQTITWYDEDHNIKELYSEDLY